MTCSVGENVGSMDGWDDNTVASPVGWRVGKDVGETVSVSVVVVVGVVVGVVVVVGVGVVVGVVVGIGVVVGVEVEVGVDVGAETGLATGTTEAAALEQKANSDSSRLQMETFRTNEAVAGRFGSPTKILTALVVSRVKGNIVDVVSIITPSPARKDFVKSGSGLRVSTTRVRRSPQVMTRTVDQTSLGNSIDEVMPTCWSALFVEEKSVEIFSEEFRNLIAGMNEVRAVLVERRFRIDVSEFE